MVRSLILLLITLLIFTTSCVRNSPAKLTDQDVENLQMEMQRQFQAMVEGDVETLKGLYTDDFVITTRRGALLGKAEWIQLLESGGLKYLSVGERTEVCFNIFGNVAVVRGLIGSTAYIRDGERLETGSRRFTAVWVYEEDTWRQLTRQHTAVILEKNGTSEKE